MKLSIVKGATSVLVRVFIQDSSKTDGSGLTGLVYNTSSLVCYRARDDDGNAGGTAISLATMTKGTWATAGFVEKDATNLPGWYEFGITNASLVTGSRSVSFMLKGATNMAPCPIEIELTGWDNQDATAGGLSRLDAAVSSRMATFTLPTNFSALAITAGGIVQSDLQTVKTQGVTCSGSITVGAFVGNATAALAVDASGRVDLGKALGSAITCTASGIIDVNGKNHGGASQTSRDLGLALPAAAPNANGGLPILSSAGSQLNYSIAIANFAQALGTQAKTDVQNAADTAITANTSVADIKSQADKLTFYTEIGSGISVVYSDVQSLGTVALADAFLQLVYNLQTSDIESIADAGSIGKLFVEMLNAAISSRMAAGGQAALVDGAITSSKFAADAISAAAVSAAAVTKIAAALDVYIAEIRLTRNDMADAWTVNFLKNGLPVTGVITIPKLTVVDAAGTTLISAVALVNVAGTKYKYNATSGSLTTAGVPCFASVTATIDGVAQTWTPMLVGKDLST